MNYQIVACVDHKLWFY